MLPLTSRGITFVLYAMILPSLISCSRKEPESQSKPAEDTRQYRVDRFGPARIVQCYAEGFEKLTLKEKTFCYYLSQAAIAGRDIYFDQRSKHGLEVKRLLEAIYPHLEGVDADARSKIIEYTKLFWTNSGFYDNMSALKFTPACTFEEFASAVKFAVSHCATIDVRNESIDQILARLQRVIFDPDFEKSCTNKTPGVDIIEESFNNFYEGVTFDEVERWAKSGNEKYPLNSKVVKENGKIVEKVWRAGGDGIAPGLYAEELSNVIAYLEKASPFACSESQQDVIRKLIAFFRTGEQADFDAYNIAWVKDNSRIDFIIGFIEVYVDARGHKGGYEGIVYYTDPDQAERMNKLASLAEYFEAKAPWKDEYKKSNIKPPIVNMINVVCETGDAGPITAIGINLPNSQAIRQEYGSKSVSIANIMRAYDMAQGDEILNEFAYDQQEIDLHKSFGSEGSDLHVALHEVIGHGSGKVSERLQGKDPQSFLPGYYSTLEEARADLMALYNGFDEALLKNNIISDVRASEAEFRAYIRNVFVQLRRVIPPHDQLEEDHMKNRQLVVNYILENSNAIRIESKEGKIFLRAVDLEKMRQSAGKLLAEIMRIKAEGDFEAGKALVDKYGLKVNTHWRDEVLERVKNFDAPLYSGFIFCDLQPKLDAKGNIIDVIVEHPLDFAKQMLEWAKK